MALTFPSRLLLDTAIRESIKELRALPPEPEDEMAYPVVVCPECGHEYEDLDGFGVLRCDACGFCTHSSLTGGICGLCGQQVEADASPVKEERDG
jgi:DNA-directed RNA polymerase subunit RPC12/RpoP